MQYYCFKKLLLVLFITSSFTTSYSQLVWIKVDSLFAPLPPNFHVYKTETPIDGKPNIAYYAEALLSEKQLTFTVDTTYKRRLTPQQYFEKNEAALLVVNATFFEFVQSRNLNAVIKNGKLLAYNNASVVGRGKDTLTYKHAFGSAIGIAKNRQASIAWLLTDSSKKYAYASETIIKPIKDSTVKPTYRYLKNQVKNNDNLRLQKWKMQTAIGGGPVLVQNSQIAIFNNEEMKFAGTGIADKHPRTGMGYTADGRLIILAVQGRFAGLAEGVSLTQEAQILKDLGCVEALNLDGGGSSCLLINGKETIKPSDKTGQRPVPAVFIIKQ
jgi:exopolysaccharide biosynthesis protein